MAEAGENFLRKVRAQLKPLEGPVRKLLARLKPLEEPARKLLARLKPLEEPARKLLARLKPLQERARRVAALLGIPEKRVRQIFSLDCGQSVVQIAALERAPGGTLKVLAYQEQKMDALGESAGTELAALIQRFRQANGISAQEIAFSVSDPRQVLIKSLILPALPDEEIRGALDWQLKEEALFEVKGAVVDWQVLREFEAEDGVLKKEVLCVAAPRITVERCLFAAARAGLFPVTITTSPVSFSALLQYASGAPQVAAVLDIDSSSSTLSIYCHNRLVFARALQVSWEKLTAALTQVLITDSGRVALSAEEAEALKETVGIPQDENALLNGNVRAAHILALMRPFLETLVREITFSFDHFSANFQKDPPAALYVTGSGANMKNLEKYLQENLVLPVARLPLPPAVQVFNGNSPQLDWRDKNMLTGAVAAVLVSPSALNLLPPEIRAERALAFYKAFARLAAFTAGAVFLLLMLFAGLQTQDYSRRLANAQRHLQAIRYIQELKDKATAYEALDGLIRKGRIPVDGILQELSAAVPTAVILEEISFDQSSRMLTIRGTASLPFERRSSFLTDFMVRLGESPLIQDVSLVLSQRTGAFERFTIQCALAP